MEIRNTLLEDLGAIIGFHATLRIVAWFAGANLYIPAEASEQHAIAQLIGVPAMRRLVDEFGNEHLWIPENHGVEIEERNKLIRDELAAGRGTKEIAAKTGLHERRVQQLRRKLEAMGLLPLILTEKPAKNQAALPA